MVPIASHDLMNLRAQLSHSRWVGLAGSIFYKETANAYEPSSGNGPCGQPAYVYFRLAIGSSDERTQP